jgi:hypothetical protein
MENRLHTTHHPHVDVAVHTLASGQQLALECAEHTIVVRSGLVYLSLETGDMALIAGEEAVIRPGELRAAWSEGGPAEVVALRAL